jgi:hypothetical protein
MAVVAGRLHEVFIKLLPSSFVRSIVSAAASASAGTPGMTHVPC